MSPTVNRGLTRAQWATRGGRHPQNYPSGAGPQNYEAAVSTDLRWSRTNS